MKKPVLILLLFSFLVPVITKAQFYNRNTYRTQRNEISFGAGASSCLTDLGGGKKIEESFFKDYARAFLFDINTDQTQYVLNFSYKYFVKSKLALRLNLAHAKIAGDDKSTEDPDRSNRNLNFETPITEGAILLEWIIIKEKSGNRYNLKNKFGKSIGAKNPLGFGLYVFGGVGGFYFNPKGDFNGLTKDLWQLKTEGQGIYIPGTPEYDSWYVSYETPSGEILDYKDYAFPHGESYQRLAICFPLGFGFRKSFHSLAGIKLEGGFRYTRTDYLDDVSTRYFNPDDLRTGIGSIFGDDAVNYSKVNTGDTYTINVNYSGNPPPSSEHTRLGIKSLKESSDQWATANGPGWSEVEFWKTGPGQIRGNPLNYDSYMFLTLSAYKKFKNTQKSYRVANSGLKRKIKASF